MEVWKEQYSQLWDSQIDSDILKNFNRTDLEFLS